MATQVVLFFINTSSLMRQDFGGWGCMDDQTLWITYLLLILGIILEMISSTINVSNQPVKLEGEPEKY